MMSYALSSPQPFLKRPLKEMVGTAHGVKEMYASTQYLLTCPIFSEEILKQLPKLLDDAAAFMCTQFLTDTPFTPESYQTARLFYEEARPLQNFIMDLHSESFDWISVPTSMRPLLESVFTFMNTVSACYTHLGQFFETLDRETMPSEYVQQLSGAELWQRRNPNYNFLV